MLGFPVTLERSCAHCKILQPLWAYMRGGSWSVAVVMSDHYVMLFGGVSLVEVSHVLQLCPLLNR